MSKFYYEHECVPYDKSITINSTFNIKRAPTDESVRLLNEFEKKALDNVLAKLEVSNNILNGICIVRRCQIVDAFVEISYVFTLNERKYTDTITIEHYELSCCKSEYENTMLKILARKLAEQITNKLLKEFIENGSKI